MNNDHREPPLPLSAAFAIFGMGVITGAVLGFVICIAVHLR